MIIRIEDLKEISQTILAAVDSNELSVLTETLELILEDHILYMNVTNREYYAQVKLQVSDEDSFHATVNANLFLKLVSQITTDTVEFKVEDNILIVKGNGTYKIPLIFDGDELLKLPKIDINNVTSEFYINSSVLNSIYQFNSKQLNMGVASKPVQKMYYVDDKGAITFTSGACVNKFTLEKPIKVLFNSRLVKLFKLFKSGNVKFTLGYDNISDNIIQTKVRFETSNITISSVLSCDDSMINSVPVTAIRSRADSVYPYSVTINKNVLFETINRLMLFTSSKLSAYCKFKFNSDNVVLSDLTEDNKESIAYNNDTTNIEESYAATLDLNDLKGVLDSCSGQYINIKFGDNMAFVIQTSSISFVVPELTDV